MRTYNNDFKHMMCLDVFLLSLPQNAHAAIKNHIHPSNVCFSLLSLDVLAMHLLQQKESRTKAVEFVTLFEFTQHFNWQVDLKALLAAPYSALVLTTVKQQILWVNKGFTHMSGYSKSFAVGRKPSFLQGKKTCRQTRSRISQSLQKQVPFTESVLNYRKNGELYRCQISITPLMNTKGELTHFIALEKELSL
jgi:PAS domain S-box-containing protein